MLCFQYSRHCLYIALSILAEPDAQSLLSEVKAKEERQNEGGIEITFDVGQCIAQHRTGGVLLLYRVA